MRAQYQPEKAGEGRLLRRAQVVVEMFLGLRMGAHFPGVRLLYGGEPGVPLEHEEADSDDDDPPTAPAHQALFFATFSVNTL